MSKSSSESWSWTWSKLKTCQNFNLITTGRGWEFSHGWQIDSELWANYCHPKYGLGSGSLLRNVIIAQLWLEWNAPSQRCCVNTVETLASCELCWEPCQGHLQSAHDKLSTRVLVKQTLSLWLLIAPPLSAFPCIPFFLLPKFCCANLVWRHAAEIVFCIVNYQNFFKKEEVCRSSILSNFCFRHSISCSTNQ